MVLKGLYSILFNHTRYEALAGTNSLEYARAFRRHFIQSFVGSAASIAFAIVVASFGWSYRPD